MAALSLIAGLAATSIIGPGVPGPAPDLHNYIDTGLDSFDIVAAADTFNIAAASGPFTPIVELAPAPVFTVEAPKPTEVAPVEVSLVPVVVPSDITMKFEIAPSGVTPKPLPPPPPPAPVAPAPSASAPAASNSHADAIARAKSASNGEISSDALCALSWDSSSLLRCDAAAALEAAAANGMPLTGMTDAYRSYGDQVAVKASRGVMAAKPGTSNHGWGIAVDIPEPARSWLHANGAAYGWINPAWAKSEKYEPWHFEFVG